MKFFLKLAATTASAMLLPISANATIVVAFDQPNLSGLVNGFYNGGTDSNGQTGPNLGVDFLAGDWNVITGFPTTSQPNFAFSSSGAGSVNVAAGFGTSVSFGYGAFSDFVFRIYSGLSGTGTLLASATVFANNPSAAFDPFSLVFSGTGRSITIAGGGSQFAFDDVTFGNIPGGGGGGVPEPAAWAMMLAGFGLAGGALRNGNRRRRKPTLTVTYA